VSPVTKKALPVNTTYVPIFEPPLVQLLSMAGPVGQPWHVSMRSVKRNPPLAVTDAGAGLPLARKSATVSGLDVAKLNSRPDGPPPLIVNVTLDAGGASP